MQSAVSKYSALFQLTEWHKKTKHILEQFRSIRIIFVKMTFFYSVTLFVLPIYFGLKNPRLQITDYQRLILIHAMPKYINGQDIKGRKKKPRSLLSGSWNLYICGELLMK